MFFTFLVQKFRTITSLFLTSLCTRATLVKKAGDWRPLQAIYHMLKTLNGGNLLANFSTHVKTFFELEDPQLTL